MKPLDDETREALEMSANEAMGLFDLGEPAVVAKSPLVPENLATAGTAAKFISVSMVVNPSPDAALIS